MADGNGATARDLAQRAQDSELAAYLESEFPALFSYNVMYIGHSLPQSQLAEIAGIIFKM